MQQTRNIDQLSLTSKDKRFIENHPKKDEEELIEIIKGKGVTFNLIPEEEAIKRLKENTYYFKISAFRKNFNKGVDGKYMGLDFACLNDLGSLDMRLRRILLGASLDLEHALKTSILTNIAQDITEDGYSIVRDFFRVTNLEKADILGKTSKNNNYLFPVYKKHNRALSVWVLFELLSFGEFGHFLEFYYNRVTLNKSRYAVAAQLFRYAKNVRNAAAHNNPLIINLTKGDTVKVPNEISKLARSIKLENKFSNKQRMIDILSLLHLHSLFCSRGIKDKFYEELRTFYTRCLRNKNYYQGDSLTGEYFNAFSKILAYYEGK